MVSIALTTLGILIDRDEPNSNLWTTVFEYFAMLAIIFVLTTVTFILATFALRKLKN